MPADRAARAAPRLLTGWGRTAATAAELAEPADRTAMLELLAGGHPRGVVARGLGRSYGDPAQNAGGLVVATTGLAGLVAFDPLAGTVTVEAGTSLVDLLRAVLPHGWFVPVTPGTREVTVGGMVAADVHGKNHHRDGSVGNHLLSLTLALADGSVRTLSPAGSPDDAELFWATVGGMGLTGVVLDATLQLVPVESAWVSVDTRRAPDLDALLAAIAEADHRRYSVAWLDCLAGGRHAGRGVVTSGEHAAVDELPTRLRRDPLAYDPTVRLRAPSWVPPGLLNRWSITAFNEAVYRQAPAHRDDQVESITRFFHPLDGVDRWNTMYGRRGFVQYQCVVPDETTLRAALDRLRAARAPSFLAVLKRFGAGTPGPLSFPQPGWTLALDLPTATPGLGPVLDSLDDLVAAAGGRVYLAKDSRMRPELLPVLYPDIARWHAVRDRVDPGRRFRSDQSRRLSL